MKERERRQRAVDKAQAALEEAEREHDKRAAALDAERTAVEKQSQAEDVRWEKETGRCSAPGARLGRVGLRQLATATAEQRHGRQHSAASKTGSIFFATPLKPNAVFIIFQLPPQDGPDA